MGTVEGPGYPSRVVVAHDFSIPSVCGPIFARITSDNYDFLSCHLFDEIQVEFELSSCGA